MKHVVIMVLTLASGISSYSQVKKTVRKPVAKLASAKKSAANPKSSAKPSSTQAADKTPSQTVIATPVAHPATTLYQQPAPLATPTDKSNKQTVRIGGFAGLSLAGINAKDDGDKVDTKSKLLPHVGVMAEWMVTKNFALNPALLFNRRGFKNVVKGQAGETNLAVNYIELQLNGLYKKELGFGKVFVGGGPVFAYGISGKMWDTKDEEKIDFRNGETWKRTDILLHLKAGVELGKNIQLSAGYQLGITDQSPSEYVNAKNKAVVVSVAYLFDL